MKNNSILILGAGEGQLSLIRLAKSAGWRTVVVSPPGNYPGFLIADECHHSDLSNSANILLIAKQEGISAIATDQTDIAIPSVQYVANVMGLPSIECIDVDNFRYKSRMRQLCLEKGVSVIPFCVTSEFNEVKDFYTFLPSGQAIIKPTDSQGSRGVTKVSSNDELQPAFHEAKKYSKSNTVIIEQFLEGQEVEVDTVVKDGRIICTLIGDVYNFRERNTFSAFLRSYPTLLPNERKQEIYQINETIISTFGLNTGWTHGEYIVTNAGVYLLEVGVRGGGNYIGSVIVKQMMGVGTDEMSFKTAIGDLSFYDRVYLRDCFCAYRSFYLPQGEVVSVDVSEGFLNESCILAHNLDQIHIGLKTHKNTDKTSRFTIVVKEMSRRLLEEKLRAIEQNIHVSVRTKDGIRGIIWR